MVKVSKYGNMKRQDSKEIFLDLHTAALFVGVSVEIFAPSVAVGMPVKIIKMVKLKQFCHFNKDINMIVVQIFLT